MNYPIRVLLEKDMDILLEWSYQNEEVIHKGVIEGIKTLLENEKDGVIILEFYEYENDIYPFADIQMERCDIAESLSLALDFFVENEEYEWAIEVRNLQELVNKNTKNK